MFGGSPVDQGTVVFPPGQPIARYEISVAHDLAAGQRVVILARGNEVAWRGGTREVPAFAVWARDSVFYEDGQGVYRRNNSELAAMTYEALSDYIHDAREAPATELIQS